MKYNYVKRKLVESGYAISEKEINKNGVIRKGIVVNNVVIYPEQYDSMKDIIEVLKSAVVPDVSMVDDRFIIDNVYIGLAKSVDQNIIHQPTHLQGIIQYLYVKLDDTASFKLAEGMYHGNMDTLWAAAEANTFAHTNIFSLGPLAYVVTNDTAYRGASAILDVSTIRQMLPSGEYVAMPSSIHEFILVKKDPNQDISFYSNMVDEVNTSTVSPEEQLGSDVYLFEV